jgi:hypothetical protein
MEINFVLISSRVQLGTVLCKECAGQGKNLRVATLRKVLNDCCCRSAQGQKTSTLRQS